MDKNYFKFSQYNNNRNYDRECEYCHKKYKTFEGFEANIIRVRTRGQKKDKAICRYCYINEKYMEDIE